MKQEAFAQKMGISQQNISKLERRKNISLSRLEEAAKVLGVSVEAIERFDEGTLLKPTMAAEKGEPIHSVKEVIQYFKEELSKKDRRIEELEIELNEYRKNKK
jgi:transcriptional regulator with XRE-family HTH domain